MAAKKTTKSKTKASRTKSKSKATVKKTAKKTGAKKKPFGGYAISFAGRKESVEKVFGKKPLPPSEMTKKIWAFVKANNLSTSSK